MRKMISIGLNSVAELAPVHNDAVESIFQINFARGQTGLEVGLLQDLSSSADMLGEIQSLRERLDLVEPAES